MGREGAAQQEIIEQRGDWFGGRHALGSSGRHGIRSCYYRGAIGDTTTTNADAITTDAPSGSFYPDN